MSIDLDRRRGERGDDALARLHVPVDAHVGTHHDMQRRLMCAAREAAYGIRQKEFVANAFDYASDERILRYAFDKLMRDGGHAPGVDGMTFSDVPNVWQFCGEVRDLLREEPFEPATLRRVEIPKEAGVRLLDLPTVRDRIVGRACVEVLTPLWDSAFDDRSHGFRAKRNRMTALAQAIAIAKAEGRWCWLTADIRNAFPSVPRARLMNVVRSLVPNDKLCELIAKLVARTERHGIPQGQPLSPLLLQAYLDHLLDKPWRRTREATPLIRAADDILILCRDPSEAEAAHQTLTELLTPAGFRLKTNHPKIRNIDEGEWAEWLGLRVTHPGEQILVRLGEKCWTKLQHHLKQAHDKDDSTLRAIDCVTGWCQQQGFAIPTDEAGNVIERTVAIASSLGFDEMPGYEDLLTEMQSSHTLWERIQRQEEHVYDHALRSGSATRSQIQPSHECRARQSVVAPPGEDTLTIYTDGSALGPQGPGGWAFVIRSADSASDVIDCGSDPRATNNQMEIVATIYALRHLPDRVQVTVYADSQYLVNTVQNRIPQWRAEALFELPRHLWPDIANFDLWHALAAQLDRLIATFVWIPAHAGNANNELCDSLARQAAYDMALHGSVGDVSV